MPLHDADIENSSLFQQTICFLTRDHPTHSNDPCLKRRHTCPHDSSRDKILIPPENEKKENLSIFLSIR